MGLAPLYFDTIESLKLGDGFLIALTCVGCAATVHIAMPRSTMIALMRGACRALAEAGEADVISLRGEQTAGGGGEPDPEGERQG